MKDITAQLGSEQTRRDVGLPTCIAVHAKFLAVGTSHGLVLVFDHFQALKVVLAASSSEASATTCVDISPEGDWLVSGHKDGTG